MNNISTDNNVHNKSICREKIESIMTTNYYAEQVINVTTVLSLPLFRASSRLREKARKKNQLQPLALLKQEAKPTTRRKQPP
jgi:hypothetical protein